VQVCCACGCVGPCYACGMCEHTCVFSERFGVMWALSHRASDSAALCRSRPHANVGRMLCKPHGPICSKPFCASCACKPLWRGPARQRSILKRPPWLTEPRQRRPGLKQRHGQPWPRVHRLPKATQWCWCRQPRRWRRLARPARLQWCCSRQLRRQLRSRQRQQQRPAAAKLHRAAVAKKSSREPPGAKPGKARPPRRHRSQPDQKLVQTSLKVCQGGGSSLGGGLWDSYQRGGSQGYRSHEGTPAVHSGGFGGVHL
jgi:hypothetical protein